MQLLVRANHKAAFWLNWGRVDRNSLPRLHAQKAALKATWNQDYHNHIVESSRFKTWNSEHM